MTRYTSQHYRAPARMPGWETNGVERELCFSGYSGRITHTQPCRPAAPRLQPAIRARDRLELAVVGYGFDGPRSAPRAGADASAISPLTEGV